MTTDDATIDQHTRMIGAPMPTAGPSADRAMVFRAVAALVAGADATLHLGALTDGQRSLLVDALAFLAARDDVSNPIPTADVADVREGDRVCHHRPAPLHDPSGRGDGATGQKGNGRARPGPHRSDASAPVATLSHPLPAGADSESMADPIGDSTGSSGRINCPLPTVGDGTAAHAQPKQDKALCRTDILRPVHAPTTDTQPTDNGLANSGPAIGAGTRGRGRDGTR